MFFGLRNTVWFKIGDDIYCMSDLEMPKKLRTHVIPQFYLRGFSDTDSDKKEHVWNYRKDDKHLFLASLKDTAVEKRFYSQDTEDHLAIKIEAQVSKGIVSIRNREPLTNENKLLVSQFIINLVNRVPYGQGKAYTIFPDIMAKVFSESTLEEFREKRSFKESHVNEFWNLKETWKNNQSEKFKQTWEEIVKDGQFPKLFEALQSMSWQLFVRNHPPLFITSNNPVFYPEKSGIGNSDAEISLAISKNIALWINWLPSTSSNYIRVNSKVAHEINFRTALNSEWLYASNSRVLKQLVNAKSNAHAKKIVMDNGKYTVLDVDLR